MSPDSPSKARDSVRRRLAALAPLAVVAAAPVTNTACDPAPDPYCDNAADQWSERIAVTATWTADPDGEGFVVDFAVQETWPIWARTPTVTGGTAIATDTASYPTQIRPDDGATQVVITGEVDCDSYGPTGTYTITLDVSGTPAEGGTVPATVTTA